MSSALFYTFFVFHILIFCFVFCWWSSEEVALHQEASSHIYVYLA